MPDEYSSCWVLCGAEDSLDTSALSHCIALSLLGPSCILRSLLRSLWIERARSLADEALVCLKE